jgi:hypothetical protein
MEETQDLAAVELDGGGGGGTGPRGAQTIADGLLASRANQISFLAFVGRTLGHRRNVTAVSCA